MALALALLAAPPSMAEPDTRIGGEPVPTNRPERLTTHPAEDYMPAVSRDGSLLAFISNREGSANVWIKPMGKAESPVPMRLTDHPAGAASPAFSPDGRLLAYVSHDSDAEGDICLLKLPKQKNLAGFKPDPERLTGAGEADRDPVFTPDGRGIIYSSTDKKSGEENLWSLDLKTRARKRLTRSGGRSPAISPDGRLLAFVGRKDGHGERIFILDMGSGAETRVTGEDWIDISPSFVDDRSIVFVRYANDTNRDGRINMDDSPSLFIRDVSKPGLPPIPLTSFDSYDLFPAARDGFVYYSSIQGEFVDVFRLPVPGIVPPSGSLAGDVKQARALEEFHADAPAIPYLAWSVAWAANHESPDKDALAECLWKKALFLEKAGEPEGALRELSRLIETYPGSPVYSGFAKVESVLINERLRGTPPERAAQELLGVASRYGSVRPAAARALIEAASAYLKAGKIEEGIGMLRRVADEYADIENLAAEAAFRRNEAYLSIGDRDRLIETYLGVIRSYPRQTAWVERAIERILDLSVSGDDIKTSTANLNAVIEKYRDIPAIQAAAMNRIARLYYEADELARARDAYSLTVSRFPGARRAASHALLQIARIYAETEDFENALSVYRSIEKSGSEIRDAYLASREGYIRQSLRKGGSEMRQGDVRLSLKTYKGLVEYDRSVTEAHRGFIRARAALGEAGRTAREYESLVRANPGVDIYMYSLGLALTYLDPAPLDRAEKLIRDAIAVNDSDPWYHQTLGWVYERKATGPAARDWGERALREYQIAMFLTDEKKDPGRAADLYLNMGNASFILDDMALARENYRKRAASGRPFADGAAESVFYQRWGVCEYRLGGDAEAERLFEEALKLAGEGDGERKIELYDRLGLARQSAGKYEEAARSFMESLRLRRALGVTGGETIVLRNIANNLFLLSETAGAAGPDVLREALSYYRESEAALAAEKKKEEKKSGALIAVEVGMGEGAAKGFTIEDEKKLIFHHMGRIYGELGDFEKAAAYFEKKLALTPAALPLLDNAPVLTEKAIVLNQLGRCLAKLGRTKEAVDGFYESAGLCLKLENVTGALRDTDNMAKLILESGGAQEETEAKAMEAGLAAVDLALAKGAEDNELLAGASGRVAQLYHNRYLRRAGRETPVEPRDFMRFMRETAADAATAERLYKVSEGEFLKLPGAAAARGSMSVSIGLALLAHDRGSTGEALETLAAVSERAASLGMGDIAWKADFFRFHILGDETSLRKAAAALESLPLGYGAQENPALVMAMIRSMYHELALRAFQRGDLAAALGLLDDGLGQVVKTSLAPLAAGGIGEDAVPGAAAIEKLFNGKESITSRLLEGGEAGDDLAKWEEDRSAVIASLRVENPLLAQIASPEKFDIEKVKSPLDVGEAAAMTWRAGDGIAVFIVTPSGLGTIAVDDDSALASAMIKELDARAVSSLYLVTGRPFTDPLFEKLREKTSVSAVPSFMSIGHFKARRGINDFRLLVAGEESRAANGASSAFLRYGAVSGRGAAEAMKNGDMAAAGALVLAGSAAPGLSNPLDTRFDLGSENGAPYTMTMRELINLKPSGSLLITSAPAAARGLDWESGLLTLSLLAGYPSWVAAPGGASGREAFMGAFLPVLREKSLREAMAAGGGRLAGSFGFSKEEKLAHAKTRFAEKIRAGAGAVNEERWTEAASLLEQALVYSTAAGMEKYEEPLLDRLSDVEYRRGRFEEALSYQRRLNDIYTARGDSVKLADSLLVTGSIEARLGAYQNAVESMSAALNIYRKQGMMEQMASASSSLGLAEESYARYAAALGAFGSALDVRRKMGDEVNSAVELRRIGRIYHLRLNRFGDARRAYGEALALYGKLGDTASEAKALIELGAVEEDAGNLDAAERVFTDALDKARGVEDAKTEALAEFHLANVNWFRGDYEPAYSWIRKSIKKAEASGDEKHLTINLNTLGLIHWTLNDHAKALGNLEKSLAIAKKTGVLIDEASALNNIGLVYRSMGDLERSIDYFTKARSADERLQSEWGMAYDARNLSISYLLKGDMEKAGALAAEAARLADKIGDRVNGAKAKLQLAEVMAGRGMWPEALEAFVEAGGLARSAGVTEALWRALRGEGRARREGGDLGGAIEAYKKAVDIVEEMRAGLKIDELKSGFLDDKQDLYEELVILLLERGDAAGAFSYSERSRARGFLDILGRSKIRLKDKESQEAYEKVAALKRRVEEIAAAMASGQAIDGLEAERRKVRAEIEAAIDDLRVNRPELLEFVTVEPVSAAQVQEILAGGAVLVEYIVTEKETVIFVLTEEGIDAVRVPVTRNEIEKTVLRYRGLIQDRAPIGDEPAILGGWLLAPVMDKVGKASVAGIIPHGPLHYLSFASLVAGGGYLIDIKPVFYAPSASALARVLKSGGKKEGPARVLALGNPDLGNLNTDLPLAELEAKSIKWDFPQVDIAIGGQATESLVARTAAGYDVVHIASHGEFIPENPLKSAIYLSPDVDNDGALSASEVFYLDLDADLVTLSACQTGLGDISRGDDVTGLNRAFLYSGARSIVSTLWRVDDMASSILVKYFYRELKTAGKAGALRSAQLKVKKRYPHPSFWAGFVLAGDFR